MRTAVERSERVNRSKTAKAAAKLCFKAQLLRPAAPGKGAAWFSGERPVEIRFYVVELNKPPWPAKLALA